MFINSVRPRRRQAESVATTMGSTADKPTSRRQAARVVIATVLSIAALTASACSSSGSSDSSSNAPASTSSAENAALAAYTGHPSPFPVDTPLSKAVPPGTTIAYLQCGAPICAVISKLVAPAIQALGATMKTVNAGLTASEAQAAASSVLSLKPSAVIATGLNPQIYAGGLQKISAAGIKVVSISIPGDTKQYGIDFNYIGLSPLQLAGKLLADWVVVNKGPKADIVFYGTPEIFFTPYMQTAFKDELTKSCPGCKLRFTSLGIATLGTTAPSTIVTDLQSDPDTNMAVLETGGAAQGLPAAMKAAGISSVSTLVYNPEPAQLQAIKDGSLTAGLGADLPVQMWTSVDIVARLLTGQQPAAGEVAGVGPFQFLAKQDITFDPTNGWTGYPDYAQRFATLWKQAS